MLETKCQENARAIAQQIKSSGTSGGGISYSTDEQDTGLKWTDDKTVYQKTIVVSEGLVAEATKVLADITGCSIIDVSAIANLATGGISIPYYNDSNQYIQIWWSATELKFLFKGYTVSSVSVTIRYTKALS